MNFRCKVNIDPYFNRSYWSRNNNPIFLIIFFEYFNSLKSIIFWIPIRSLRSSDKHYLVPTPTSTNFSSRSFRSAAPVIWNAIPLQIRLSSSIDSFNRNRITGETGSFCKTENRFFDASKPGLSVLKFHVFHLNLLNIPVIIQWNSDTMFTLHC